LALSSLHADLESIYCECRQPLFTCALVITRSAHRAEDAVHDAFCRLFTQDKRPSDLKAYVFRAVRNAALDQLRRHAMANEQLPNFIFDNQERPDQLAEDAEFTRQIADRLLSLPDDERETIVQHLYGELTFQQIADIREAPLGTVVSWYRRGLEKLRAKLECVDGSV
jgi:RNA polymerase sigma-70 factor (ECF subfamily)